MNERKTPISSAVSDEESALNRLGIKTYHRRTIRTGIFLEREERVEDIFMCHAKTGVSPEPEITSDPSAPRSRVLAQERRLSKSTSSARTRRN